MKKILIVIYLSISINAYTQLSSNLLPDNYVSKMKIKRIVEIDIADSSKRFYLDFYDNGLLKQRTFPTSREEFDEDKIDTKYIGKYLTFYEAYYYDSFGNLEITAASWTGLKENYIMLNKFKVLDNDTSIMFDYNTKSIIPNQIKSYYQRIKDTVQLENSIFVYLSKSTDTLFFKEEFKTHIGDSIVYFWQYYDVNDIITRYYVYTDTLLVSAGIVTSSKDEPFRDHERVLFDKSGYPYLIIEYDKQKNRKLKSILKIEKFK